MPLGSHTVILVCTKQLPLVHGRQFVSLLSATPGFASGGGSSRVVHKQFGAFLECKLCLQDPAAPDLQAEEASWTALLLAVSTHSTHFLYLYANVLFSKNQQ